MNTKNCLDPWSFVLCKSNGDVMSCCWHSPIGTLQENTLEEILSGAKAQSLRKSLLSGDLNKHCKKCPARENCTTTELESSVNFYLENHKTTTVSQGKIA